MGDVIRRMREEGIGLWTIDTPVGGGLKWTIFLSVDAVTKKGVS